MANKLSRSITYAQLVALIGSNGLYKGQQFTITDFATKHFMLDPLNGIIEGGDEGVAATNTGTTEPLTVTATSANTLSPIATSALFPNDVIYYDWNPAHFANDYSFCDVDGDFGEEGEMVAAFKGVITRRTDLITQVDCWAGDFRNVKTRRWKHALEAWADETEYFLWDFIIEDGYMCGCIVDHTADTSFDAAKFTKLINVSTHAYIGESLISYSEFPVDVNDYEDFLLFESYKNGDVRQMVVGNTSTDEMDYPTLLSNSVFFGEVSNCVIKTHYSTFIGNLSESHITASYYSLFSDCYFLKILDIYGSILGNINVCDFISVSVSLIGNGCENVNINQLFYSVIGQDSEQVHITRMEENILPNGTLDTIVRYLDGTYISSGILTSQGTKIIEWDAVNNTPVLSKPDSVGGGYVVSALGLEL